MKTILRNIVIATITVFTALYLSSLLFAYSNHEGSHVNLTCTECHLTQPDFNVDTIETVDLVTSTVEELCISCHSDMTMLEQTNYCLSCHDLL